jgi:hypothetical protein
MSGATTRIETAKRHLRTVRIAVAAGSVALFGGTVVAARASHAASGTTPQPVNAGFDDDAEGANDFEFGDGSIGPSQDAVPSLQSRSS